MARRRRRRGRRKKGSWFKRLSVGKKIGVCLGGVVLCLLASGVVYVAAKLGKVETKEIPAEDIIVNDMAEDVGEGYTNFALFGIDSREGNMGKGTRTDCIIVASLNNATKEVKMVSVYRDTVLDLSEGTLQKCNAAYSFGGPEQAINMLNMNLDLDIQDYVTVDFAAIADAIDLLGGLDIEIQPEEISQLNQYVGETAMVAGKAANTISGPGLQHLDGVQATTYARIRKTAGGDFRRTERQRIVIEKIVEKAQQSNLATINKIIDTVFPKVATSLSMTEILSYAKNFAKYKLGETSGFPFEKTTATISGLGSVVIPVNLETNVQQLHAFLYGTENYDTSSKVKSISSAVVSRVGERQATDDEVLNNRTYTETKEDLEQERNNGGTNSNGNAGGGNSGNGDTGGGNSGSGDAGSGDAGGDAGGGDAGGGDAGGGDAGGGGTGGGETGGGETSGGENP